MNTLLLDLQASSFVVTVHYVRTTEGFAIVEEEPEAGVAWGLLEIEFDLNGVMGGPAVTFRELQSPLCGALLDTPRHGAPASLDIRLPEGVLTARDGVGDWTRLINLSKRKGSFEEKL